ncbi:MAG: fumarylacetoacetate hydrolase family protein [Methylococcales bacterium]|nr:fumarylacetoacetate hydrolase family protein [Methylococcales bacterium]MDD5755094.1 fumarylacetoacetate hydrolase family protein [Methylococcales bacterium]
MKLATFTYQNQTRIGAVIGHQIVDGLGDASLPLDMITFLEQGDSALQKMQMLISSETHRITLIDVQLLAPIPRPRKYLGIGLNYADHVDETGLEKPEYPMFFTKQSSCVVGHGAAIEIPAVSEKVDYEGELAFVIGKRCKNVSVENAPEVIAGFTIANDVTVRDWQFRSPTWTIGKSFDTHGPIGPWIVTTDEILNPHALSLKTWVDDELRQNSNTCYMMFNCYEMIAYLSQAMTLEVGDVITTGTPSGVGVKMKPRGYLKAGQVVKIEIEGVGTLVNPVI